MKNPLILAVFIASLRLSLSAQTDNLALESEVKRIDALTGDPDIKLAVVGAMADQLNIHRNHLILLRKESGQSYGAIFVSELRSRGIDDSEIVSQLRALNRKVNGRLDGFSPRSADVSSPRPVASLSTGIVHNPAGTFYSLVPEIGIDSSHVALVVGVPYYRVSAPNASTGGVGDVYVAGFLRGRVAGFEVGSTITLGTPTGDRSKGLGSGKTTIDGTGTIAKRIRFVRPWLSAGFTNSVFNNIGYQRPYVEDGNALHFSGELDWVIWRRFGMGFGGFALRPTGNQTVYYQVIQTPSSNARSSGSSGGQMPGGMMPGGSMPGMGNGPAPGGRSPGVTMPFYEVSQMSIVSAADLEDHGVAAWATLPLYRGFSLNISVARSVPFHLTTARFGVGIDVARLFFKGKR